MIPVQPCTEQVWVKTSKAEQNRMGREEMADSELSVEEDVEADSDLSLAGLVRAGSDEVEDTEERDWFDDGPTYQKRREEEVGGDGRGQPPEESMMEDDSWKNVDSETDRGSELDEKGKEKETDGTLEVCLWPVQKKGDHVRICLEEVERYSRFSRCCRWLCGRCPLLSCDSFNSVPLSLTTMEAMAL